MCLNRSKFETKATNFAYLHHPERHQSNRDKSFNNLLIIKMPNIKKIEQVDQVAQKLTAAKSAALIQYQGLNAADITDLRSKIKSAGGKLEVVKNTLITRALAKLNLSLPQPLTGPTGIAYCNDDEVAPLKEIDQVNKDHDFITFKYGFYQQQLLGADELKKFISLPSKSTLLTQLVGNLIDPLQRLSYSLRYNQTKLALALKAVDDQKN